MRKSKEEIKKELEDAIINNERHENKELVKISEVEETEDAAAVIREFEEIIKSKKKNIVWSAYQQGKVFKKFKENAKFIDVVKQFGVSKSTIIFKINILKLIDKHPKIKNTLLSLHFLKNYFKMIKEMCEENSSEFE